MVPHCRYTTIRVERKDGEIYVMCPKCGERQVLPKDWYDIAQDGKVSPVWVCVSRTQRCRFQVDLWIVN